MFDDGLGGIFELGGENNDFFVDIIFVGSVAFDDVGETVADGGVDSDVEAGFFFDLAEGGLELGLAWLNVAFGEAPVVVGLVFE